MGIFQADLISQCRSNNRKAQLTLYNKYCEGMFAVAMRFMENESDAEDVLQEAFIKAFQKLDQYRGEVSFGAWLKRIVINKCLDCLRAKKETFLELKEYRMAVEQESDWQVETAVQLGEVKKAIATLPDKYREVIQLYLIEGYDHSEISEILNIQEPTCRTRLLRAKNQIKELLKNPSYVKGSQKSV